MKYKNWIILSLLSVYFAEVVSGSFKYPLFDAWGYIAVIPIYGLHTLVLLYLCRKDLTFNKLYMAGVIFGLYEAYLTKVLWTGLAADAFHLGPIALLDFIVLVFLWHPIMSFIVPLYVYEHFFTSSKSLKLPKISLWFVILFIGVGHAVNYTDPLQLLVANALILVPLYLFYRFNSPKEFENVIPNKKELIVLMVTLIGYYIVMGLLILPEVLNLWNQVVIWIIYAIQIIVFIKIKPKEYNHRLNLRLVHFIYMLMIPIIITAFYSFGVRYILMVVVWIIWIIMGVILYIKVLRNGFIKS